MKKDIHPEYNEKTKVSCACGNEFTVGSTQEKIEVEICSNCHPFYTGEEQLVDTAGRAEKFKKRQESAKKARDEKQKRDAEKENESEEEEKTETEKMVEKAREKLGN